MKARADDPRHLDVEACAKGAVALGGSIALPELSRLAEMAPADAAPAGSGVSWQAQGESRTVRGGGPSEIWLHLEADTMMPLVCQRCLNPVLLPVQARRSFRFVVGEDAAAQLDAEIDDELAIDVLALPRVLDLNDLIEDELLLALPLVPRHEVCPEPLPAPAETPLLEEPAHPFAVLDALKRGTPPN